MAILVDAPDTKLVLTLKQLGGENIEVPVSEIESFGATTGGLDATGITLRNKWQLTVWDDFQYITQKLEEADIETSYSRAFPVEPV